MLPKKVLTSRIELQLRQYPHEDGCPDHRQRDSGVEAGSQAAHFTARADETDHMHHCLEHADDRGSEQPQVEAGPQPGDQQRQRAQVERCHHRCAKQVAVLANLMTPKRQAEDVTGDLFQRVNEDKEDEQNVGQEQGLGCHVFIIQRSYFSTIII
jgi:hypothetical protein